MRTVAIKSGLLGRFDDRAPFLLEEGALKLRFILPQAGGEYYLTRLNSYAGGQTQTTVQIPASGDVVCENLHAGELTMEIKHYLHGELIEIYKVEPLLIKKTDGEISATPELIALREEIAAAKKAAEEFENSVVSLGDDFKQKLNGVAKILLDEIHKRDIIILSFAYAEYREDLRLNERDLSLEDFIKAFGLNIADFSEEELKKIQEFTEEL